MGRKFWLIIVGLVLVVASIWRIQSVVGRFQKNELVTHPVKILDLRGRKLDVDVVSSTASIKQGLSDLISMEQDKGMLFELGFRGIHPFWMNRMLFPLDIIWIDGDRVVEIAPNLPAPGFLQVPATHTPKVVADRVLEVNAGVATEAGLKVGDTIGGLTGE